MSTPSQIAANRVNAQLSTGPKSAAGKSRSSENSFRHGFSSQTVIITGEDPEEYEELLTELLMSFPTAGEFALDRAVREMANAEWRLRRVRRHMEIAINGKIAELQAQNPDADVLLLQAQAMDTLAAESNSYKLLLRYETKFENQYNRAQRDWYAYTKLMNPVGIALNTKVPAVVKTANWVRSAEPGATPRNAPCPCGSGEKYKRCCGRTAPPVLHAV